MAGFVYVMSNPAMPNLVKVGKSDRDPETHRKYELETTGVPDSFNVEYSVFVDDHDNVERVVHKALSSCRYKPNREFFECSIPTAINAIQQCAAGHIKYEEMNYQSPEMIEYEWKKKQEQEKREREAIEARQREEEKRKIREHHLKLEREKEAQELSKKNWKETRRVFLLFGLPMLLMIIDAFSGSSGTRDRAPFYFIWFSIGWFVNYLYEKYQKKKVEPGISSADRVHSKLKEIQRRKSQKQ